MHPFSRWSTYDCGMSPENRLYDTSRYSKFGRWPKLSSRGPTRKLSLRLFSIVTRNANWKSFFGIYFQSGAFYKAEKGCRNWKSPSQKKVDWILTGNVDQFQSATFLTRIERDGRCGVSPRNLAQFERGLARTVRVKLAGGGGEVRATIGA